MNQPSLQTITNLLRRPRTIPLLPLWVAVSVASFVGFLWVVAGPFVVRYHQWHLFGTCTYPIIILVKRFGTPPCQTSCRKAQIAQAARISRVP